MKGQRRQRSSISKTADLFGTADCTGKNRCRGIVSPAPRGCCLPLSVSRRDPLRALGSDKEHTGGHSRRTAYRSQHFRQARIKLLDISNGRCRVADNEWRARSPDCCH
jgi:hypothetical protein